MSTARIELATPGLGNQCSIQLSYVDVCRRGNIRMRLEIREMKVTVRLGGFKW